MPNQSTFSSFAMPVHSLTKIGQAVVVTLLLTLPISSLAASPGQESTPEITRTDVERRINMAERLLDKGNVQEAIRNLKITSQQYRYNADVWNLLGFAYRQDDNLDAANEAYMQALAINRHHLGALEYQGELFIAIGKLDDARVNLRLMSDLCPIGCAEQRDLEAAIAAAQ